MEVLTERYADKRSIMPAQWQKLWTLPSMKSEYDSGLRQQLETTEEHLTSLEKLSQLVDKCQSLLVFLVSEKKRFRVPQTMAIR